MIYLLFFLEAAYFLALYLVPALRAYRQMALQNFDYGILFNSSDMLSRFKSPYMSTRGLHAWADNQDYFQIVLSAAHYFPDPHYALITMHSVGIWAGGIVCFAALHRKSPAAALLVAGVFWLSPLMINMSLDLVHTEAFATVFLLSAYLAAESAKPARFHTFMLLALACKEDVAITVAAFCALAYFAQPRLAIRRHHFKIGFITACAVFLVNQGIVLPYYKTATCEWLSSDFQRELMKSGTTSPWFGDLGTKLTSASFYRSTFLSSEAARYVLVLLWPLAFVLRLSAPFFLLPLPAAAVNLIASGYLIRGTFHYDHSTFAAVMIAVLIGCRRARRPAIIAALMLVCAYTTNIRLVEVRVKADSALRKGFFEIVEPPRLAIAERLAATLPRDIVLSIDLWSTMYFLSGRDHVYMFENPLRGDYFGIYGVCDGNIGSLDRVPPADLVILSTTTNMRESSQAVLRSDYERFQFQNDRGAPGYYVYLRRDGARFDELLGIILDEGATPAPFDPEPIKTPR